MISPDGHHDPHDPLARRQRGDERRERRHVRDVGVAVVPRDLDARGADALAHVRAHLAQTDQTDVHAYASFVVASSRALSTPPASLVPQPTPALRRLSAGEADRHQQVAVLLVVLAVERLLAGELHRLVRVRERQPHERRAQRAQAVEQELRVERHRDVLADERRLERLGGLRVVALAGVEHDLALGERQPDRGVALGDEADALRGVGEGLRADDGVDRASRPGTAGGRRGSRRRPGGSWSGGRRPRSR